MFLLKNNKLHYYVSTSIDLEILEGKLSQSNWNFIVSLLHLILFLTFLWFELFPFFKILTINQIFLTTVTNMCNYSSVFEVMFTRPHMF